MYDTNREGNPVSLANLIAELEAATGATLSSQKAKHRIWTAVERLTPPERNLLNMIYFREEARRSDQELAAELGIDEPALSRKRREVLDKLLRLITDPVTW